MCDVVSTNTIYRHADRQRGAHSAVFTPKIHPSSLTESHFSSPAPPDQPQLPSPRTQLRTRFPSAPMDRPSPNTPDGFADGPLEGPIDAAVQRRLTVAVCWALARRAALDSRERYEDSFALSEEFREWLLCLEEHPEELRANVLMVPKELNIQRRPETDGLLEI